MAGKRITLFCAEDQPRALSGALLEQAIGLWSRENGIPRDKLSVVRDGEIRGETEKTEVSFLPFAEDYVLCLCTEVPFALRQCMLT